MPAKVLFPNCSILIEGARDGRAKAWMDMIEGIEKCIHLMKEQYSLDISMYETSFLEKTIQNRMRQCASQTTDEYLLILGNGSAEASEMMGQLSNSYSEFFRNPLTFTYLERMILPALIGQKIKGKENEIRIWSAACASGQEIYSMAILVDEIVKSTKQPIAWHLFATDIDRAELEKARRGGYQMASVNNVSLKRINSYFTQQGDTFTVNSQLRKYIDFSVFDLLSEECMCPPASVYGNFDLVFCSNLLFYYKPEYRQRIIDKAGKCLAPGGYLITGETERETLKEQNYREVFPNSGIFEKR